MHTLSKRAPTRRVAVPLTQAEIEKLDDWGFAKRIRARADVIRQLAFKQLAQESKAPRRARV
jgi:hypothetical protein